MAIAAKEMWEFGHFSLGRYYDKMLVQIRASAEAGGPGSGSKAALWRHSTNSASSSASLALSARGMGGSGGGGSKNAASEQDIVLKIVKSYGEALRFGHANIFHSLPRLLTLWFETASAAGPTSPQCVELNQFMSTLAKDLPACVAVVSWLLSSRDAKKRAQRCCGHPLPVLTLAGRCCVAPGPSMLRYQWLTALPQLISRISHGDGGVYKVLVSVLVKILKAFPSQSLWALIGASETANRRREERIHAVLHKVQGVTRLDQQVRARCEQGRCVRLGLGARGRCAVARLSPST